MIYPISVTLFFVAILAAVVVASREALLKYRAQTDLASAFRTNEKEVAEIGALISQGNVGEAVKLFRKYADELPIAEQREVESALDQRSYEGRLRYMRGVFSLAGVALT